MIKGKAKLIATKTLDGLVEVASHITLGKEYTVDISSRRISRGMNVVQNTMWTREVIDVLEDETDEWKWMPTELLEIIK